MGYSNNIKSVQRVEQFLQQMTESQDTLVWTTDNPRLIYYIREGIHASAHRALDSAGNHIEPYYTYSQLTSKFILKAERGKIIARPRTLLPISVSAHQSMNAMVIPQVSTTLEVIGAALAHHADEMHFPDAKLVDLNAVYRWTTVNNYHIAFNQAGLLITRRELGEIEWKPQVSVQ
jgi:hypothetical protein